MKRIDILLFRSDGQKMDINLNSLIISLCNAYKIFKRIEYNHKSNTLFFCASNFDISFPKECNRFSISAENEIVIEILNTIIYQYEDQKLFLSTPGYEVILDPFSSSEAEINNLLGL